MSAALDGQTLEAQALELVRDAFACARAGEAADPARADAAGARSLAAAMGAVRAAALLESARPRG